MKKKILIAVVSVICLLSVILAGCSTIQIADIDKDFIGVINKAIQSSEKYTTFYIREKFNSDPTNIAINETTEYLLNWQADDKSIAGVDNTKVNLTIKHIKGIDEYSDTFTFGQSLKKGLSAKKAKAEDYKFYVFENYKQSSTAPVFTKSCRPFSISDIDAYVTPQGTGDVNLQNYKIANALSSLAELTKDDVKINEKKCVKKGKVTTYVFEVTKEGHKYKQYGEMQVLVYQNKDESRIMAVSSLNEKYTLDVMYQGPIINIANYDTFQESDNKIDIFSTRSDGMVELYEKYSNGEYRFVGLINPADVNNTATKKGEENNGKITTVESAVNWSYEYTEIVLNNYKDSENNDLSGHYFIKTSNIVQTKKDFTSLIPMAAAIVAIIALLIALVALFKIKKQNKELTKQIKVLSGEAEEESIEEQSQTAEENADGVEEATEDNQAVEETQQNQAEETVAVEVTDKAPEDIKE